MCNLGSDAVTSVNWTLDGSHLAVGTGGGDVQIWDLEASSKIRTMQGHTQRVGALAWNNPVLSSGSRDRTILQRDIRSKFDFEMQLTAHRQEVCGLKWSFDNQQLASGGNDNKLFIWTLNSSQPMAKFQSHTAAVKAIAWSPHQHGLLVSGGGTADRCIRFWNTLSCKALSAIDTGSQVCNLMFSKNVNELVSTHGYSQHQIAIWQLPGMKKIASLTGHTSRVL